MKRLLRIALNITINSLIPILVWFCLGLLVDKNLVNVFTLTYPFQFIYQTLNAIFATGANICAVKEQNKDDIFSGMTIGTILSSIIFGIGILKIDDYIKYMNMDATIYREFAIYSLLLFFLQLVLSFVLEKLYYEEKEKVANKYCLTFNILNFGALIISSLITKNKLIIISITLSVLFIYILSILIKQYKKFKFEIHILRYIKYNAVDIANCFMFFIIFLFGLKNALSFGEKYIIALNFVALITDTQWDAFDAIATVAKIDISKNKFNYIEHRNNGYKLLVILVCTTFLMLLISYNFYDLDIIITLIYLSFEIFNFIIYPIYRLKTCWLQLEYNPKKMVGVKLFSDVLRFILSLLKTPFCTGIGQVSSSVYQFITFGVIFNKYYKIDKEGNIMEKKT